MFCRQLLCLSVCTEQISVMCSVSVKTLVRISEHNVSVHLYIECDQFYQTYIAVYCIIKTLNVEENQKEIPFAKLICHACVLWTFHLQLGLDWSWNFQHSLEKNVYVHCMLKFLVSPAVFSFLASLIKIKCFCYHVV